MQIFRPPSLNNLKIEAHFYNVKALSPDALVFTEPVMFKNVQWSLSLHRSPQWNSYLVYLDCQKHRGLENSSITVDTFLVWPEKLNKGQYSPWECVYKKSETRNWIKEIPVAEIDEYLTGRDLVVTLHMKYTRSEGIQMELEDYSEPNDGTNGILVASGVSFHVNKFIMRCASPKLEKHFFKESDKFYEKICISQLEMSIVEDRNMQVITARFHNVNLMEPNSIVLREPVLFKNVNWALNLHRDTQRNLFILGLDCQMHLGQENYSITIESNPVWARELGKNRKGHVTSVFTKGQTRNPIIKIPTAEIGQYLTGADMKVNLYMKYIRSEGIRMEQFDFSKPVWETDVTLRTGDVLFFVNEYLIKGSSPKLYRHFSEKSEGCFKEMISKFNACSLQNYLELVYNLDSLTDGTITGVLNLASILEDPRVVKICEKYLMEKSLFSNKKKRELAETYELEKLKEHVGKKSQNGAGTSSSGDCITLD